MSAARTRSSYMLSLSPAFTQWPYHSLLNLLGEGPAGMWVCVLGVLRVVLVLLKASSNSTRKDSTDSKKL